MEKITIEKKITTVETVKVDIELPVYLRLLESNYYTKIISPEYCVSVHPNGHNIWEGSAVVLDTLNNPDFTPSTQEEFLAAVAKYKANVAEFCKKMEGELSENNLTIK